MKILFVYTNINGFHADSYGVGLAHIMSVTRDAGHEIKLISIFEKEDYYVFEDTIKEFNPKVIGFTTVSSQWSFAVELAGLAKNINSMIYTVTGGVHPTLHPECVLETNKMDAIFMGEAEHAFTEFLNKIDNNQSWESCENIAYEMNGKLIKNPMKPLLGNEELEVLPHPDRDTYSFLKVMQKTGFAPFHFTRGCPFTCTYCSNIGLAKVYGLNRYNIRSPSPERCIQELEETIEKYPQIKTKYIVTITDDIFGLNKKWRREFLALYRERIKLPFICLLRCDVVNEDFMQDLKRSYCYKISFGLESGSEYIRNTVMDRKMPDSTIIHAFELAHKYKIKTNALNVIGVPGETEEMLWDTIRLNKKVKPTTSGCNIFYPYQGTPLGDKCFDEKLVNLEKFHDFSNERRQSVLDYDKEWLDKLIYYHENWDRLTRSEGVVKTILRNFFRNSKSIIKTIPIAGPAVVRFYRILIVQMAKVKNTKKFSNQSYLSGTSNLLDKN